MTWAVMLPVLILFVHDKPEPLGLRPDNEPATQETAPALTGPDLGEALLTIDSTGNAEGTFVNATLAVFEDRTIQGFTALP